MSRLLAAIGECGVVPVLTIDRADDALPLARALRAGGLGCAEITFRTPAAAEAIRRITIDVPDMLVGAGTVRTVQQAAQAIDAGARFIVAPGFDAALVDWGRQRDVPMLPGVATPTEINMALAKGLSVLKFFPAQELGGIGMLKALYGPYPDVTFVPTGGISAANVSDYLSLPNVLACGGSWMAAGSMITAGQFDQIERLAREARAIVRAARGT